MLLRLKVSGVDAHDTDVTRHPQRPGSENAGAGDTGCWVVGNGVVRHVDEGQCRDGDVVGPQIKDSVGDAKTCRDRKHAGVQDPDGTAENGVEARVASAAHDEVGAEDAASIDAKAGAAEVHGPAELEHPGAKFDDVGAS